jgi:hypothetical protein
LPEERDGVGAATEMTKQEILSWLGVSARPHQFSGIRFYVNNTKEIGHLLGEKLIGLPFSPQTRKDVVDFGRALPHHIYPESEWVIYRIREVKMMWKMMCRNVTALFQLKYERLKIKKLVNFMLKVRHKDEMIIEWLSK